MIHVRQKSLKIAMLTVLVSFCGQIETRHFKMAPQADPLNFYTGILDNIHVPFRGDGRLNLAIKGEYCRSFRAENITHALFGTALSSGIDNRSVGGANCDSECGKLFIQGSRVPFRRADALLADYFGLAPDFSSEVTFAPRIEQGILDLSVWYEFDRWWCGGWAFIRAPIVWQKVQLRACERIINDGILGYDQGYFTASLNAENTVTRQQLLNSFGEFTSGNAPSLNATPGLIAPVVFEPLQYRKFTTHVIHLASAVNDRCCDNNNEFPCDYLKDTKVGDIHMGIGWDFWQDPDYCSHVGAGFLFVAPTGTRVRATNVLAPQIGNNHHFELGALVTSHYLLWSDNEWGNYMSLRVEAQLSHLFKSCERHTFGVCNPRAMCAVTDMSEYMLATQFSNNPALVFPPVVTRGSTSAAPTPWTAPSAPPTPTTDADGVISGRYAPVANLTTRQAMVSVKAQGYILAVLNYCSYNFSSEVGYQLYARSCDEYHCPGDGGFFSSAIPGAWALKGDTYSYGYEVFNTTPTTFDATLPIPLSASQSQACITHGLNFNGVDPLDAAAVNNAKTNPNIDNAQFAYESQFILASQPAFFAANPPPPGAPSQQTHTSIQPVYLSDGNVNVANERTKERTHTIFGSINYHWDCFDCWEATLGIGIRADFSGKRLTCNSQKQCKSTCHDGWGSCAANGDCRRSGLTQWGIWIKCGAFFE